MHLHKRFGALALLAVSVLVFAGVAAAATVVVTQNSPEWVEQTAAGGDVEFTEAYGAPAGLGEGAVELTTTADTASRAGLFTDLVAGTPLADVTTLGYWAYQAPGNLPHANASYQLPIDANGDAPGGFTTLVYEPYWNGVITPDTWEHWDVDAGLLWSSRTVADCGLVGTPGGPPTYTLATVKTMCPDAVVLGIGANIGTFNPNYVVAFDGIEFNDTTYDFEVGLRPSSKDDCKDGGWMTFDDPAFKNQGDCVSFFNETA
jgi:hypothetical protein